MVEVGSMTTHAHDHDWHRPVTVVGTLFAVLPLVIGLGATLLAFTGRFGGAGNAFTAFWYVAAALAPVPLLGAALLLLAHWHDDHRRPLATWSGLAVAGWVFGMGSAQVTGLADGPESAQEPWMFALLGVGVGVYLIALVGLTLAGRRATLPPG